MKKMVQFVQMTEIDGIFEGDVSLDSVRLNGIYRYASFLSKPLTLGMFVPCDEDGNVLEEPIETIGGVELYNEQYQQAKKRVLFEGFTFDDENNLLNFKDDSLSLLWSEDYNCFVDDYFLSNFYKTIEDLIPLNLTLINPL